MTSKKEQERMCRIAASNFSICRSICKIFYKDRSLRDDNKISRRYNASHFQIFIVGVAAPHSPLKIANSVFIVVSLSLTRVESLLTCACETMNSHELVSRHVRGICELGYLGCIDPPLATRGLLKSFYTPRSLAML